MGYVVLGAIAVLLLWYFAAKEFQEIAAMKGYTDKKYFWWTFLAGFIGVFMIIALPNIKSEAQQIKTAVDELPEI